MGIAHTLDLNCCLGVQFSGLLDCLRLRGRHGGSSFRSGFPDSVVALLLSLFDEEPIIFAHTLMFDVLAATQCVGLLWQPSYLYVLKCSLSTNGGEASFF